ncbi:MAG: carboxymuconolactone decarboxylase family protein [Candidatus Marinimicrobia bacterium]|nr:carboxymuconolactone decarboxylase family protein [Candidatus Neomarinimicrobiota bacterium]MDZ7822546.1 carboxymuconolactone decarboxylase family protein [Candidatus Neomarinimicrobiota bacterium]
MDKSTKKHFIVKNAGNKSGILNRREIELVALGAAIGGNCIPCLEWHFRKCVEAGLTTEEIREAIAMSLKVKNVPINKINETAERLLKGE